MKRIGMCFCLDKPNKNKIVSGWIFARVIFSNYFFAAKFATDKSRLNSVILHEFINLSASDLILYF